MSGGDELRLCTEKWLGQRLQGAARLQLFLDYDGTLAEFAPTPDHVLPDPEVSDLVSRLAQHPAIRVAVVSGRRLGHVQRLLPVPGILLAGTYGIEMRTPEGQEVQRADLAALRPTLESIKGQWQGLIAGRDGFFLEDKGWAVALHGRRADPDEADQVLATARRLAQPLTDQAFRTLGGYKFLEVGS
ncbi:MAG: trehalose-phosphatase, partial [Chloroflexi bacterium]|nr:trehalose-phosphatase [Chloroflexota bacterium]